MLKKFYYTAKVFIAMCLFSTLPVFIASNGTQHQSFYDFQSDFLFILIFAALASAPIIFFVFRVWEDE